MNIKSLSNKIKVFIDDDVVRYGKKLHKELRAVFRKNVTQYKKFIRSHPVLQLMRLDDLGPYVLLIMPVWWTIVSASIGTWKSIWYMMVFAVGGLVGRSLGCVINDMVDVRLDGGVLRTQSRPMVNNNVTFVEAIKVVSCLSVSAVVMLIFLPKKAIIAAIIGAFGMVLYPFMKYITYFAQVILGVVFNVGVLVVWYAIKPSLTITPILIYMSAVFWTIGYDTIYGHQDRDEDIKMGVKSLSIKLMDRTSTVVWNLYKMAAISLWLTGLGGNTSLLFTAIMGLVMYLLYQEIETLDINDPANCREKFRSNIEIGVLIFIGMLISSS